MEFLSTKRFEKRLNKVRVFTTNQLIERDDDADSWKKFVIIFTDFTNKFSMYRRELLLRALIMAFTECPPSGQAIFKILRKTY